MLSEGNFLGEGREQVDKYIYELENAIQRYEFLARNLRGDIWLSTNLEASIDQKDLINSLEPLQNITISFKIPM